MRRWLRVISVQGLIFLFAVPALESATDDISRCLAFLAAFVGSGYVAHLIDLAIRLLQIRVYENAKAIKEFENSD